MNSDEFRTFAKVTVDYIADYLDDIRGRQVLTSVNPGYLKKCLPETSPQTSEPWISLLKDVDEMITPGLTHWHHPNFHAYYPTANSYPAVVAELILSGLGIISTDEFSDPIFNILEQKMMDWLAKLLNLPTYFLNTSSGKGGGVIQNAASESTLLALLAAKKQKIKECNISEDKLIAYTSEQSNSSVEKAGLLASVQMKLLPTDKEGRLRGSVLLAAIQGDILDGFTPCCVIATLGTTGTCAFDQLNEIGPICHQFQIWLHVDAAYAGSVFCCPEYRFLMDGIEYADSFNMNPHKWMLVNSDCSAMWFKNTTYVEKLLNHKLSQKDVRCWQLHDTRRFRAIKLWFVLRNYGTEGIQNHIRKQIQLAKYFEDLVKSDDRFEICTAKMGLVCFRLKGDNLLTEALLNRITQRRNIFVMQYYYRKKLVIRFVICSRFTEKNDILFAWEEIRNQAALELTDLKTDDYKATETVIKSRQISSNYLK